MDDTNFIRQGLYLHGMPVYEADIPYIRSILYTMNQAKGSLQAFSNLHEEVPVTIVDKGLLR